MAAVKKNDGASTEPVVENVDNSVAAQSSAPDDYKREVQQKHVDAALKTLDDLIARVGADVAAGSGAAALLSAPESGLRMALVGGVPGSAGTNRASSCFWAAAAGFRRRDFASIGRSRSVRAQRPAGDHAFGRGIFPCHAGPRPGGPA